MITLLLTNIFECAECLPGVGHYGEADIANIQEQKKAAEKSIVRQIKTMLS